jgi:hypothetical protein
MNPPVCNQAPKPCVLTVITTLFYRENSFTHIGHSVCLRSNSDGRCLHSRSGEVHA